MKRVLDTETYQSLHVENITLLSRAAIVSVIASLSLSSCRTDSSSTESAITTTNELNVPSSSLASPTSTTMLDQTSTNPPDLSEQSEDSGDVSTTENTPTEPTSVPLSTSVDTTPPVTESSVMPVTTQAPQEDDASLMRSPEHYMPYSYEVGEKIGKIYTNDGLMNTDLYLTDTLDVTKQVKPAVEDGELDYIHLGAGLSLDSLRRPNGSLHFPGMIGNQVILAHETTNDKDYFRNHRYIKAGTLLTLEYHKNGFRDVLLYKSVTNPVAVGDDYEAGSYIYDDKDSLGIKSSLTTYTCRTSEGSSDERSVIIWELVSFVSINDYIG